MRQSGAGRGPSRISASSPIAPLQIRPCRGVVILGAPVHTRGLGSGTGRRGAAPSGRALRHLVGALPAGDPSRGASVTARRGATKVSCCTTRVVGGSEAPPTTRFAGQRPGPHSSQVRVGVAGPIAICCCHDHGRYELERCLAGPLSFQK